MKFERRLTLTKLTYSVIRRHLRERRVGRAEGVAARAAAQRLGRPRRRLHRGAAQLLLTQLGVDVELDTARNRRVRGAAVVEHMSTPTSMAASSTILSAKSRSSAVCEAAMQKRARERRSGVAG